MLPTESHEMRSQLIAGSTIVIGEDEENPLTAELFQRDSLSVNIGQTERWCQRANFQTFTLDTALAQRPFSKPGHFFPASRGFTRESGHRIGSCSQR